MTTGHDYDIESPLLEADKENGGPSEYDDDERDPSKLPQETKLRLNALSFATGAFAVLLAETILACLLKSSGSGLSPLFALQWSSWTCACVLGIRLIFLRDMKASYCPEKCDTPWNSLQHSMELWLLFGGLTSLATWWASLKFFSIALPFSEVRTMTVIVGSSAVYIIIVALTTPRGRGPFLSSSASFYNFIATLWGFVNGFGSQIILGYIFHSGKMDLARGGIWNPATVSLTWSLGTVLVTVCGIALLCILKPSTIPANQRSKLESDRIYLRMESFYILCAIMGISFSWIALDMIAEISNHVIPSCAVLLGSAILFRAILYCFPEEECLEDIQGMSENSIDA